MAEFSKISWTDGTFNPWIGCTRVSPGCQNCYAENLMDARYGRVKWGPGNPRSRTKTWGDPVRWNRQAAKDGVRKKVFCASLADWLDDGVPDEWRADLLSLVFSCESVDWLMLTKRPENFANLVGRASMFLSKSAEDSEKMMRWSVGAWFPDNVWFGVTAENQEWWDRRVPILESIPAALRWVSYEPALGELIIPDDTTVEWLIIGGESEQGSLAREFKLEWAANPIMDCRRLGVTPFMKQVGSNATWAGHAFPTKDRAGADPSEWLGCINVQEFPVSPALLKPGG